jgi:hypothetical protein
VTPDQLDLAGPAHDDAMSLSEFTARAEALGVEVHEVPGREADGDCLCQMEGWPAEVTVYSDSWEPTEDTDVRTMCRDCALREIARDIESGHSVLAEIPAVTA